MKIAAAFLMLAVLATCFKLVPQTTSQASMLDQVSKRCLDKLDLNVFKFIYYEIEFWQTWANLEFVTLMLRTDLVSNSTKDEARYKATQLWTNFSANSHVLVPAYFQAYELIDDNFWDPKNTYIIWDDRQWLGLSYVELYREFSTHASAHKYLEVAEHLYDFIVKDNADPSSPDYIGVEWKPGTNYRNCVTNQLLMVLAGRLYHLNKQDKHLSTLKAQYKLMFTQPKKYINNNTDNVFPDAVGPDGFYTYNQGMALEGLAYLALFDPNNSQQYMRQLARMINGFTRFFRDKSTDKYILRELTNGNKQQLACGSVFRGMLLRHLIRAKILLTTEKPDLWQSVLQQAPILKIFVLDNFQAMLKYENLTLPYYWEQPTGIIHVYNEFNHFYGLYAGHEILGLEELVTDGIEISCQSILSLETSTRVKQVRLRTLIADVNQGKYVANKQYIIGYGLTSLKTLLGEDLCSSTNNRNVLALEVVYTDATSAKYTLAHIPSNNTKFSIIPDRTAEEVANGYGVRIQSSCVDKNITYRSELVNSTIILQSLQKDCSAVSNIRMKID